MTISATIMALFIETHYATLTKSQVDPGQPYRLGTKGKGRKGASKEKKRLLFEWPRGLQGSTSKMMISNAKKEKEKINLQNFYHFFTES